ncbi:membrane protein insertase YidC [Pedobacter cryoconitis]|uniref:Membrane protein insertase YidC n=1 Tax=Pedobacter cryoconitis TaxID=188932 RepID=A0A327T5R7_9SPHI|nr:membrane protein insertase YidC [Pedobacter cryoconitis]MBB5620377.1 YidC/Oxa1 family membrane protein insertase [Pedobacter cryoconitis]RAJ35705.1 YidC/Oxa1 family membrane protein insertase [Pedobacter cryoconitis]
MDKNTFTGLFLIMIVLAGSFYFFKPSEAEMKKERERISLDSASKAGVKHSPAALAENAPAPQLDSAALKGPFGTSISGTATTSVLENEALKLTFTNKGGKIKAVEVKGEKTYLDKPVVLFDGDENIFGLTLNVGGKLVKTNDLYFTATKTANAMVMRANYSADKYIEFVYDLQPKSHNVGFNINLKGMNQVIQRDSITLDWETVLLQQEKSLKNEQQYSAPYYKYVEKNPDHLSIAKDETESLAKAKIEWIAFKQHFFSAVLIPADPFNKVNLAVRILTEPGHVKGYAAKVNLPFNQLDAQNYKMKFYFGTNQFKVLKAQGQEIEKLVEMGYWPLKYINRFVVLPVFNFLESFGWNYGLIILVLTIALKVVLSPLTYKSYISMAKMRILKPEMDEIKAKVGEDNATLLQQEYLKLYKQVGVNPLGGCLPMLLQLPIVMAFFFFFPNLFELRGQSFLWMHDLSTYDDFIKFGFTIPFIGDHLSLMCVLMTISTLIYTYFNNQVSGATGQMKYIGYIMPVVFLGVLNSYPAGLNYYYFLANMLTFGQQFLIKSMVNDEKIHNILKENKKKPEEQKKKSKFQTRLDDYMRQQQQVKTQEKKNK